MGKSCVCVAVLVELGWVVQVCPLATIGSVQVTYAVAEVGGVPVTVQSAQDARFGDYQSNVAMQLARPRRANPRKLATEIIAKLQVDDLCEKPEIAGRIGSCLDARCK